MPRSGPMLNPRNMLRSHKEIGIAPHNQSACQHVQLSGAQTSLMVDGRHHGRIVHLHQNVMPVQEVFQSQKYFQQLKIIHVSVSEMYTPNPIHCPPLEHTAPALLAGINCHHLAGQYCAHTHTLCQERILRPGTKSKGA